MNPLAILTIIGFIGAVISLIVAGRKYLRDEANPISWCAGIICIVIACTSLMFNHVSTKQQRVSACETAGGYAITGRSGFKACIDRRFILLDS